MKKLAFLKVGAMLCAVACAMALAAGTAFGLQASPGDLRVADADAFLSVYVQDGDDGAPKLAKSFTQDELTEMAEANTENYATMYIGHGVTKVVASTCYVTLSQLCEAAGQLDVYIDPLTGVQAKDASGSSPDNIPLKRQLDECNWFYPGVTYAETHSEGGYTIPPVVALTSQSKELGDTFNTAGDLAADICSKQTWANGRNSGTRFLWGMSPAQLEAGDAAGNRLWSNVASLVLVEHAGEVASAAVADQVYTGSALTPAPTVIGTDGKVLAAGTDFDAAYAGNTAVGTATVTVTGKNRYLGSATATFKIAEAPREQAQSAPEAAAAPAAPALAANPVKVTAKKLSVAFGKTKKFAAGKAFKVKNNKGGKASYKKVSGDKRIKVASNGKVTVKKGLKKGKTYKVKVKASFKATSAYKAASKTVTLKVKVK